MRHGETDWNLQKRIQGMADIDLNETGKTAAILTGQGLSDVDFDIAFTSPLRRARETARLVLKDRDVPIHDEQRIREINFGVFEGLAYETEIDVARRKEFARFFEEPYQYQPPENGETIREVCARTKDFYQELIHDTGMQDKRILLVSHGCAVRAFMQNVYEPSNDFWHGSVPPNCGISIIEVKEGSAALVREDTVFF
ncbi:MAG: histidine phosphatase family protein [Lachnospiraceae bacterium]